MSAPRGLASSRHRASHRHAGERQSIAGIPCECAMSAAWPRGHHGAAGDLEQHGLAAARAKRDGSKAGPWCSVRGPPSNG